MIKLNEIRENSIRNVIIEGKCDSNIISIDKDGDHLYYKEIIKLNEINEKPQTYIENLVDNELDNLLNEYGYFVDYDLIDTRSSDFYDGYELKVPIFENKKLIKNKFINKLFTEIDNDLKGNVRKDVKLKKSQSPRKVDLILKNVFESKFYKYRLQTDVGHWIPIKTIKNDGKLMITWENKKNPKILIETLIFPNDTNKIKVQVKRRSGETALDHFFEIYRIPTDEFIAERFFRKTFFTLLKKYIDTKVIQLEEFSSEFVFWKTDNPTYSYSFSSPNKNKIILDLISFINVAKQPTLDDFFEQNNLKHKQGYLQTLLDSAEAAGIFSFKRVGNEIVIVKGANYKAFLEGKVRRVVS